MPASKKIRVAVLYGGRSGEHEVSLRSAASVVRNLDRNRFEVISVAIDKQGRWLLNDSVKISELAGKSAVLAILPDAIPVALLPEVAQGKSAFVALENAGHKVAPIEFDVVFPVIHGPLCEDGTIQGILELAEVPYVGCGVLASSVGMDKDVAKRLARDAGLPIVPFVSLRTGAWLKSSEKMGQVRERVQRELGFPVFVKPANMGSSVGVHKVREAANFDQAVKDAFRYDTKVLVERAVDAREIEIAVMENSEAGGAPLVSVVGEIVPTHEFYSYEAKYLDENGAVLKIPADLNLEQIRIVQQLGRDIFEALECEGMARVDLFLDRTSGKFFFNEVNTIPGFTSISMYPKLWEAAGMGYSELLSRLVDLALARQVRKHALLREFKA